MNREIKEELGGLYVIAYSLLKTKSVNEVKEYMKKKYGASYHVDRIIDDGKFFEEKLGNQNI